MKRKHRRLLFVLVGMAALGGAAALVLSAFQENLVFFFSPSEVAEKHVPPDRRIRIGGLVEKGSLVRSGDGMSVRFVVTDGARAIPVRYRGLLPDLFREGSGVVCEGYLRRDGSFEAEKILAKHDETYMPREVAEALKKSGHWRGGAGAAAKGGGR